jgi:hypothetical protein
MSFSNLIDRLIAKVNRKNGGRMQKRWLAWKKSTPEAGPTQRIDRRKWKKWTIWWGIIRKAQTMTLFIGYRPG